MQCAVIGMTGMLGSLATCSAFAQDSWSYEATPFLWAAGMDGRVGLSSEPIVVAAKFDDLADSVNIGAAMRITARRPPAGWFGEASWVEFKESVGSSSGTVHLKTTQTIAEGGLLYEFHPTFAIYGGVRYQDIDTTIDSAGVRQRANEGWVDGIAGARWTPLALENWVAWARADVGGGSADLVWLAEAGAGYRWNTRWGAYVAYRVLDTDYEHDGFLYDVQQSGLLLGFGFRY